MVITALAIVGANGLLFPVALASEKRPTSACKPMPSDALGPFYKPNAPLRTSVGKGYVLTGSVKSSQDCLPVEGARIEFWLAGPNGRYDDNHRATLISDRSGRYGFQSNFPPAYSFRRPHIHIRVTADGYEPLVTQHYPLSGQTQGTFDLVMIPGAT
jgi:protocatechuate 3,4-dioxygenase beta subunit